MSNLILPKKHYEKIAMAYVDRIIEALAVKVVENHQQGRHVKGRKFRVAFTKPKPKVCNTVRQILESAYIDLADYVVHWDGGEHLVVLAEFKTEPDLGQVENSVHHRAPITAEEAKEGLGEDQTPDDAETIIIDLDGNELK